MANEERKEDDSTEYQFSPNDVRCGVLLDPPRIVERQLPTFEGRAGESLNLISDEESQN